MKKKKRNYYDKILYKGKMIPVIMYYDTYYLLANGAKVKRKDAIVAPGVKSRVYYVDFINRRLTGIKDVPSVTGV